MSIGVIIVNYFTESLLRPLVEQVAHYSMVRQVVVVDNGSLAPLSFEAGVRVISEGRNMGFAAAVNRGLMLLPPDCNYVLLLNPDMRLDAASVARLLEAAEGYRCPIVGPRFYWDEDRYFRLPPATGALTWLDVGAQDTTSLEGQLRTHAWSTYHDHYWSQQHPFRQPFLPGSCLLLAMGWIRARGRIFDERYFMYYEDTDLCLEAMQEGWMPLCVPKAELVHYWDQSPAGPSCKAVMMANSGHLFRLKHRLPISGVNTTLPVGAGTVLTTDLGDVTDPPSLRFSVPRSGATLEIGVGADFVPFAQARLGINGLISRANELRLDQDRASEVALDRADRHACVSLVLPERLWMRLQPSWYHSRVRDGDGKTLHLWRWQRLPPAGS